MKRKIHKRLAWILAACMILTMMPATAFAADIPAPTGLKLGVEKIYDPEVGSEVMYSNTFTHLGLHWDKVASMEESVYSYNIEASMTVSGSGIVIPGDRSGSTVRPFVTLFNWFTVNDESVDYTVDQITMTYKENSDQGPAAVLNTDITVQQVEATEHLTACYIGTKTVNYDGGSYEEATFQINDVPADHSAHFELQRDDGGGSGTVISSSSTGVVTVKDTLSQESGWQMSLGDMEVNEDHEYYLDVFDTVLTNTTTASMTITRYPVDIVFDSFDVTVGGPLVYSGSQITPAITVKTVGDSPVTLNEGTDYTLSYEKDGAVIDATAVKNAGTYIAVIEGKAGADYEGKVARKTFTVAKADPDPGSYTIPTGLTATYGQTLADVVGLSDGFSWADPGTASVGNPGSHAFNVKYTPADTANYNEVTGITVNVEVSKANQTAPTLTLSSITAVVGISAPALSVSGGNGIGAWSYMSSNASAATVDASTGVITIVAAGTTAFTASKAADANYNASSTSAGVTMTIKDKVDLTVKDTVATEAALVAHLKNQGQITVGTPTRTGLTNNFTLAVNGKSALTTYASSNAQQGEAKWIGLLIGNIKVNSGSAYAMTDLYYKTTESGIYTRLDAADASESLQVGGTDKELVLWIKSDVDTTKNIWLATGSGGENETKLTINFTPYTPSTHSGGGGGGGGTAATVTPTPTQTETKPGTTTVSTTVASTTNAQGTATAAVPSGTVTGLIDKAKAAEAQDKKAVIEINVSTDAKAKAAEISIPKTAFDTIVKETKAEVKVETRLGAITFDEKALETISGAASVDNINIRMETLDSDSLSEDVKALVGERPIYDLTVSAGNTKISSFNGGTANISVPYTLNPGENQNAVVVYYVDDNGSLQTVRGAYHADTGTVEFVVGHFSKYAVGYNKVSFADVSNSAWYQEAVTFLSAREITTGTSNHTFSPNAAITRGEFIVMLMRAYGIEPTKTSTDNFADAGNAYYKDYLAAAKKLKITQGVGNNLYQPNAQISRQDMFTMLYRALDVLGEVPTSSANPSLGQFSDSASVSSYAKTSVEALVSAGIVSGSNGKLDPAGKSTRAQMAQILLNLLSK